MFIATWFVHGQNFKWYKCLLKENRMGEFNEWLYTWHHSKININKPLLNQHGYE